jgi:hypothetical protein
MGDVAGAAIDERRVFVHVLGDEVKKTPGHPMLNMGPIARDTGGLCEFQGRNLAIMRKSIAEVAVGVFVFHGANVWWELADIAGFDARQQAIAPNTKQIAFVHVSSLVNNNALGPKPDLDVEALIDEGGRRRTENSNYIEHSLPIAADNILLNWAALLVVFPGYFTSCNGTEIGQSWIGFDGTLQCVKARMVVWV